MEFRSLKVNGNTEEIKAINLYLKTLEQEVFKAQHLLLKDKLSVTYERLENRLLGIDELKRMLVLIFEDYNRKLKHFLMMNIHPQHWSVIQHI
jgi:hypothetical protein